MKEKKKVNFLKKLFVCILFLCDLVNNNKDKCNIYYYNIVVVVDCF